MESNCVTIVSACVRGAALKREKKSAGAAARKAMGVRKNEENPVSICRMISELECDMYVRLSALRV